MTAGRIEERLRSGLLARCGALTGDDLERAQAIVRQVERDGLETVRVLFADPHGLLRGKTVTAHALVDALADGVRAPSTLLLKDASHRTVFPVWTAGSDSPLHGVGDVLLAPALDTFRVVPWSPHSAIVLADLRTTDGEPLAISTRGVLKGACGRLSERGYTARFGLEVEFQVFEVVDDALDHASTTLPGQPPATRALHPGYEYLNETRYGRVEPLLDTLRRSAEALGMPVRSVEIEMGPSQFEFTFDAADPVGIADTAVLFRVMAKEVCQRQGLLASFMTRPRLPNAFANGWHIHQSIADADGHNLFIPRESGEVTTAAGHWIAGLLEHARAACIATTPTVNGYRRFTEYQLAPNRIGWAADNRGAMLRTLFSPGEGSSRIENRVAESALNPYLALAFQLESGMDGLARALEPPAPLTDPYDDVVGRLPATLLDAIDAFEASDILRAALGDAFSDYLVRLKRGEWDSYVSTLSEWEQATYFADF